MWRSVRSTDIWVSVSQPGISWLYGVDLRLDTLVAINPYNQCGECPPCLDGRTNRANARHFTRRAGQNHRRTRTRNWIELGGNVRDWIAIIALMEPEIPATFGSIRTSGRRVFLYSLRCVASDKSSVRNSLLFQDAGLLTTGSVAGPSSQVAQAPSSPWIDQHDALPLRSRIISVHF